MKKKITEKNSQRSCKDGGWEAYFARKKGSGHIQNNMPCQDYCLVEKLDGRTLLAAVADGHGGEEYTHSDRGSRLACEVLVKTVKELMQSDAFKNSEIQLARFLETRAFVRRFLSAWKEAVKKDYGNTGGLPEKDLDAVIRKYGTTLLFALVLKSTIVLGQIGDGAILLFDGRGRNQLFKRHDVKRDSATNSLVSSRAEYTFVIRSLDRRFFNHFLLSTDGIYDKLDNNDSFLLYGKDLVGQSTSKKGIDKPFQVEDIDVSAHTRDDCTIVLVNLLNHNEAEISAAELLIPYEDVQFVRACGSMEVYHAYLRGKAYEIHLLPNEAKKTDGLKNQSFVKLVEPTDEFCVSGGRYAYVYPISNKKLRLSIGVEYGYQAEKKYTDSPDVESYQTNECWLKVYESLSGIQKVLNRQNLKLGRHFQECTFVDPDGNVEMFSDAFLPSGFDVYAADLSDFLKSFGILGKLKLEDSEMPIFKTKSQGQIIMMPQGGVDRSPFCCVMYNTEKHIFGLVNLSKSTWKVLGEEDKTIKPKGVLRLNKDRLFVREGDEKKVKNLKTDITKLGKQCPVYSVKIFEEGLV